MSFKLCLVFLRLASVGNAPCEALNTTASSSSEGVDGVNMTGVRTCNSFWNPQVRILFIIWLSKVMHADWFISGP